MYQDASSFINDTLNNVLSMQKIEEGSFFLFLSCYMYVCMYGCTYVKVIISSFLSVLLGKLDLDLSMFSLASCISKVFATFRGNSIEKKILLTKHLSAIVPPQVCMYV